MTVSTDGLMAVEVEILQSALQGYIEYATSCAASAYEKDLLDLENMWRLRFRVAQKLLANLNR